MRAHQPTVVVAILVATLLVAISAQAASQVNLLFAKVELPRGQLVLVNPYNMLILRGTDTLLLVDTATGRILDQLKLPSDVVAYASTDGTSYLLLSGGALTSVAIVGGGIRVRPLALLELATTNPVMAAASDGVALVSLNPFGDHLLYVYHRGLGLLSARIPLPEAGRVVGLEPAYVEGNTSIGVVVVYYRKPGGGGLIVYRAKPYSLELVYSVDTLCTVEDVEAVAVNKSITLYTVYACPYTRVLRVDVLNTNASSVVELPPLGEAKLKLFKTSKGLLLAVTVGGYLSIYRVEPGKPVLEKISGVVLQGDIGFCLVEGKLVAFSVSSQRILVLPLGEEVVYSTPLPPEMQGGGLVKLDCSEDGTVVLVYQDRVYTTRLSWLMGRYTKLSLELRGPPRERLTLYLSCTAGECRGINYMATVTPPAPLELIVPPGVYVAKISSLAYGENKTILTLVPSSATVKTLSIATRSVRICVYSTGDPQGYGFGRGPVPGAFITITRMGVPVIETRTWRDGCTTITLGYTEYTASITAQGYTTASLRITPLKNSYTVTIQPQTGTLQLAPLDALTGEPARVEAVVEGLGVKVKLSTPITLRLPQGFYKITLSSPYYGVYKTNATITPGSKKLIAPRLKPVEYTLTITVTDTRGKPVRGASIHVEGVAFNGAKMVRTLATPATGIVKLKLPPGKYKVKAVYLEAKAETSIELKSDQRLLLRLAVGAPATTPVQQPPPPLPLPSNETRQQQIPVLSQLVTLLKRNPILAIPLLVTVAGAAMMVVYLAKRRKKPAREEGGLEELLGEIGG